MPIIIAKKRFVFNRAGIVWAYYKPTKLQTLSLIGLWLLLQLYACFFINFSTGKNKIAWDNVFKR